MLITLAPSRNWQPKTTVTKVLFKPVHKHSQRSLGSHIWETLLSTFISTVDPWKTWVRTVWGHLHTDVFSGKYYNTTWSRVGWIHGWRTVGTEGPRNCIYGGPAYRKEQRIGRANYKLYRNFRLQGRTHAPNPHKKKTKPRVVFRSQLHAYL